MEREKQWHQKESQWVALSQGRTAFTNISQGLEAWEIAAATYLHSLGQTLPSEWLLSCKTCKNERTGRAVIRNMRAYNTL